jgi:CheY-like chemotaxis protein
MPKNLLLADDSITIQKVVGITFAAEDFKVTSVGNGEDAIAKARELKPDVILADVVMPKRNGYEVCEAVKTDPGLSHIPVLLLAGTFEAFDEARARSARADGHISKPFESQALINKVKELVGGAPAGARPPAAAARPPGAPAAPPPGVRPGAPMPPGARPPGPGAAPFAGARPPAPGAVPPGARPPGAPAPLGARPPGPVPPGGRPPGAWAPPPGARPPPPGAMPAGARPLGPVPPGAVRPGAPMPPPAARPPAPGAPLRPPGAVPPAARPVVPAPVAPAPVARPAPAAAPAPAARKDPFGLGVAAPARAAPVENDWSDLDVSGEAASSGLSFGLDAGPARSPAPPARAPIELPNAPAEQPELAPMHAFVPPAASTGHKPTPSAPADGGEALLRDALSKASRDVIERVVWEVVPELAETIIRENLDRLVKQRQG